jgi:tRNA(Ile)-lysidine synthetase-like protein
MNFNKNIFELSLGDNPNWNDTLVFPLCSSGVDSVAATHFLFKKYYYSQSIIRDRRFSLMAFHIDHNYREQNEQMLLKFSDFCRIECFPNLKNVLVHHGSRKTFTEDYLRKARLEVMSLLATRTINSNNKRKVIFITGHHLDDCIENYMLNVIRGHPAYAPMPVMSKHTGENYEYTICRPFIFSRKQEMIDYCKKHDLMRFVEEDSTNLESKGSRRNMIRNEILPILERDKVGMAKIVKKMMEKRLSLDIFREG